jgi:conjugal transfer pilus assembly protein TraB
MTRSQAMSTPQDKAGFMARGSHSLPAQPGTQGGSAQAGPNPALGAAQSDGIVTLTWAAPASSVAAGSAEGSKSSGRSSAAPAAPAAPSADRRTFLTSGAFFSADLLMGLDAPTGGQAQQNPQPVLMRVTNNAFLPSRVRSTVKECFVTGDAFGDQSSERAYIRAERLSCVTHGGQAIEIQISAAVAGEDGKVGLRGRLVQKQGAILQQALLASVASGIGQAFRSAASTQSVSPLGTTSTVQPGKGFEAGFAGGISSAADRLANYYIALAEKLHPVIEVDAGRHVTVMIQQGFSMNSLDTTISGGDDE